MNDTFHGSPETKTAVLKVLYLLAVTAVIFTVPAFLPTHSVQWFVISSLLVLQTIILLACGISGLEIARPIWRLKWLFLFLIGVYALLPPERPSSGNMILDWRIPGIQWLLSINLTGVEQASLMCLQIMTLLLASAVVRTTGKGSDLVVGLRAFRLPPLFVYSLDHTLELLGGMRRPGRHGNWRDRGNRDSRGGPSPRTSFRVMLKQLVRGDIGAFVQIIQENIELAGKTDREIGGRPDSRLAHDVAVVSGIALCMASLKMLKFLPGLPFASGHKAILLFPLYILASRLTYSRWGGTAAGSIMGVIGFFQGDGRFGILEVLKHLAPGLVIDLGSPLVRRLPPWALGYCFLGLVAAIARTTTELVVVLLLGARAEVYIFPAAKLIPNLVVGFLSGFVTILLLKAFSHLRDDEQTRSKSDGAVGADLHTQSDTTGKPYPPTPFVAAGEVEKN